MATEAEQMSTVRAHGGRCGKGPAGGRRPVAQGRGVTGRARPVPGRRPAGGHLLPGPLVLRQGRPLHPRRELHGFVLVEGLRQGRDHHLGVAADRLPERRAGTGRSTSRGAARAGRRSPGTRTRRRACATRTRGACWWTCSGEAKARLGDPGRGLGGDPGRPGAPPPLPAGAGQGRPGARGVGRGAGDDRGGARTRDQGVRPRPGRRILADPGDVDGVARGRALGSSRSSAARCCPSTTGTPTCRSPRRRCSATRPTYPSRRTGGTPPI